MKSYTTVGFLLSRIQKSTNLLHKYRHSPQSLALRVTRSSVLLSFLSLIAASVPGFSADLASFAPHTNWVKGYHQAVSVIRPTSDGGHILVGEHDSKLVKIGPQGNVQWAKSFSHVDIYDINQGHLGYFASGVYRTANVGANVRYFLVVLSLDELGNVKWSKAYDNRSPIGVGQKIITTRDGGFLVSGVASKGARIWLLRLDQDGKIKWEKSLAGNGTTLISELQNGDILLGADQGILLKLSADGKLRWRKRFSSNNCCEYTGLTSIPASDGEFFLAGQRFDHGKYSVVIFRLDADGSVGFAKEYSTPKGMLLQAQNSTSDGGIVFLAEAQDSTDEDFRSVVVIVDAQGNEIWSRSYLIKPYAASILNYPRDIIQTFDQGYLFSSLANWTIRLDAMGNLDNTCGNVARAVSVEVKPIPSEVTKLKPYVHVPKSTAFSVSVISIPFTPRVEVLCK